MLHVLIKWNKISRTEIFLVLEHTIKFNTCWWLRIITTNMTTWHNNMTSLVYQHKNMICLFFSNIKHAISLFFNTKRWNVRLVTSKHEMSLFSNIQTWYISVPTSKHDTSLFFNIKTGQFLFSNIKYLFYNVKHDLSA